MTRSLAEVLSQKKYRRNNKQRLYEYKKRWEESKGKTAINYKYFPVEKRREAYEPLRIERLTYSWVRYLFK